MKQELTEGERRRIRNAERWSLDSGLGAFCGFIVLASLLTMWSNGAPRPSGVFVAVMLALMAGSRWSSGAADRLLLKLQRHLDDDVCDGHKLHDEPFRASDRDLVALSRAGSALVATRVVPGLVLVLASTLLASPNPLPLSHVWRGILATLAGLGGGYLLGTA